MTFTICFLAMLLTGWMACSQPENNTNTLTEKMKSVPELLDRPEELRNGIEWDKTQNFYTQKRDEILADPENATAKIELAELYMQEARVTGEHGHYYPAALLMLNSVLDQNLERKDEKFRALSDKASVQMSLHDFGPALETAEKAVAINAYNAQIYGVLVDANVELGNYEEAVKMADKMVSIRPDLRSYSRVSYLREIYGKVDGAIEALEMAIEAGYPGQESRAWAMLTLGNLFKTYGELDKAEVVFKAILEERPNYPFAIAGLGDVEMERGNYEKSEELLKEAAAIIPEVGFYESLATLYKKMGRDQEKEAVVAEIFPMLKDDTSSGHNMDLTYAHVYLDLEDKPERALAYAKVEYDKRPDNIDVNRIMARIYKAEGNQELYNMHLQKAKSTNSQHPELVELLASN
ncbi:MAG: hypothetical protein R2784_14225 [Saprospiraceae bacterium]